jgi:hypothetical protein
MSMSMVAQVRDFSKSKRDAKFLLLTIASYINPITGWAWPSLATLAHVTSFGKPYILKMLQDLEALGELEVRRGHGRGHPNHYRITIRHEPPPEAPVKGNPSDDRFPGVKVISEAEKVIEGGRKGHRSDDSKAVLRTVKETTERVVFDMEQVKGQDRTADAPEYEYWPNHNPWHRPCGTYHLRGQPCPEGAATPGGPPIRSSVEERTGPAGGSPRPLVASRRHDLGRGDLGDLPAQEHFSCSTGQ